MPIDRERLRRERDACVACSVCGGGTPNAGPAVCYFCRGRGYSMLAPGFTEADYLAHHPGLPSLADALNRQAAGEGG